jgi:superfamily II DNA or RNA helicase
MNHILRERIQLEAAQKVIENNGKGTVEVATGVGKTFIAFKFLYLLQEIHKFDRPKVWFLAETNTRLKTLNEEIKKFFDIYSKDVDEDFEMKFHCYQGMPIGNPDIIIADEIHESLTKEYSKIYDNPHKFIIGLSATIPQSLKIDKTDPLSLNKGELINKIAPIVYTYTLEQGIDDGILSPYTTRVIEHTLDDENAYISTTQRGKRVLMTELQYYNVRENIRTSHFAYPSMKKKMGQQQVKLLWALRSKAEMIKSLLLTLEGKTIIFATEIDLLQQILSDDNIVAGTKGDWLTKKKGNKIERYRATKSEKENKLIIDKFNSGEITVIGSAKKLKQGITLEGVTNCIIVSYYSKSWHFIQQLGRIVRFVEGKLGILYIVKTKNTLEEKWFQELNKVRDKEGQILYEIDLNLNV